MASIYLARATKHVGYWFEYPHQRIIESQKQDAFGSHKITDSPGDADVILFATNYSFPPLGLGILSESVFRRCFARCVVFNSDDNPSPIFGGLCASWPRSDATPGLAVGWCYHHPTSAEANLQRQAWPDHPRYLWSFCGSRITHPVRGELMKIRDSDAFIEDTSQLSLPNLSGDRPSAERERFIERYVGLLASSAFIVCPCGNGPSSMRIFEAMRAGRAPVIIADEWTPPPFVEWEKCSLRLHEGEIDRLPDFLREHRPRAKELGERARDEWSRVFGPSGLFNYTVEACLMLLRARPRNLKIQRFKRCGLLLRPPWRRQCLRWLKQQILSNPLKRESK